MSGLCVKQKPSGTTRVCKPLIYVTRLKPLTDNEWKTVAPRRKMSPIQTETFMLQLQRITGLFPSNR